MITLDIFLVLMVIVVAIVFSYFSELDSIGFIILICILSLFLVGIGVLPVFFVLFPAFVFSFLIFRGGVLYE